MVNHHREEGGFETRDGKVTRRGKDVDRTYTLNVMARLRRGGQTNQKKRTPREGQKRWRKGKN